MRIGMVLNSTFPPDIRVEKEARSLIKAGFEVCLLAQKTNTKQATKEYLDYGLEVFRYEINKNNFFSRQYEKFTLVYKTWLKIIDNFVNAAHPDVLHAHDFRIVPTVLKIGKKYNLPVVADLHENMPAALIAYRSNLDSLQKLKLAIFNNYYVWRWHERHALRQCSRIIVVVLEASERLLNGYKIPHEKIQLVSNTEDETTFNVSYSDNEIIQRYQDTWTALYIGGIGFHRGIDTSIRAATLAGRNIPNFKLLIVGIQNDDQQKYFMKMAKEANASQYVELINWVPSYKVNSYIAASEVCLVPHNNFEHTNTTVPHKLFQYMMMKKPIIVSSCAPLKRIVEDAKCGLVFNANDSNDLAFCLAELYKNWNELSEKYGVNGYQAALGRYSWKNDSQSLVNMYNELFDSLA